MRLTWQRDAEKPSMTGGQLAVRVLGTQTEAPDSRAEHTVYRTAVNFRGACLQRLIRFRDFSAFSRALRLADTPFPPKTWTRKAALRPETVEARRVLLDQYMQRVCAQELAPRTEEKLLRLLQVDARATSAPPRPRLSKASSAGPDERRTLDVALEDEAAAAAPAPASAPQLRYQSVVDEMMDDDELAAESQQSSGEIVHEADARARRSASLPPAPVLPVALAPSPPPTVLRASESLPPTKKMVEFADSPVDDDADDDDDYKLGAGAYADSGASSASSSPSPSNKYQSAVLQRRTRIGELLQASGARLSLRASESSAA